LSREHIKVRVDASVAIETKQALDEIIAAEREEDRRNDRPERFKSAILEMMYLKAIRVWKQEHADIKPIVAR
jgi:hypothetical protein